ncbi:MULTISPECIES: hypothetical protein [unclassified Burkholderia]|uniref:hypothetical protein n=1 Tax=unclassified Burkholderia TaxID=2613784 RepID=UPI001F04A658|nr:MULTISPECIES: hypothetical protein [unclassified Burkholderia]
MHPQVYLRGYNPYARIALTHDWGPHSVMVGAFGMSVDVYPNDANNFPIFGTGVTRYRDYGFDAQYEYLLEPHTITAQARYVRENIHDPNNFVLADNTAANLNSLRLKAGYVYQNKYGVALSYLQYNRYTGQRAILGKREFLSEHARLDARDILDSDSICKSRPAVHALQQVPRREDQLRRQWPQREGQRYAVPVSMGRFVFTTRPAFPVRPASWNTCNGRVSHMSHFDRKRMPPDGVST